MKDAFDQFCDKRDSQKRKKFQKYITDARGGAGYSAETFIDSCQEFLVRNGFLTEKQMGALIGIAESSDLENEDDHMYDYDYRGTY